MTSITARKTFLRFNAHLASMSDNLRTKWSKGGPKLEVFRKINTIRNAVATANGRRPSVLLVIKITCCASFLLWLMLQHDKGKENNASLNALQAIIQDYLQKTIKGISVLRSKTRYTKKHEKQSIFVQRKLTFVDLFCLKKLYDLFSTFHIIFYKPKTS